MSEKKFRHAINFFLSKLFPGVAYFVLINVAASRLEKAEYAMFSIWSSVSILVASLCIGWFNQYQLRRAGIVVKFRFSRLAEWAMKGGLLLVFSLSLIGYVEERWEFCYFILFAIISYVLYLVRLASLQASLQSSLYRAFEFFRAALLMVVAAIVFHGEIQNGLAVLFLIGFTYILPWVFLGKKTENLSVEYCDLKYLKKAMQYGWPIALWLAVMGAQPVYERWLIGFLASPEIQGEYSAVQDSLVRAVALFMMPMTMSIHAQYMKLSNTGDGIAAHLVLRSGFKWILLILFAWCLGLLLGLERIFFFIFSGLPRIERYLFWMLVLAGILWQAAAIVHKPLERANKTKAMLTICVFVVLFSFLLSFVLFAWLGVMAIPVSSGLAALMYIFICSILNKRIES